MNPEASSYSVDRRGFYILAGLLVFIAAFELLPFIKEAQRYVTPENLKDTSIASCDEILSARPWYGKINHWFFTWIIFVPAMIFGARPRAPKVILGVRVLLAAVTCYVLLNLAVHLQWDIRNAPFRYHSDPANKWSEYKMDCDNAADGFSLIWALYLGWIPAGLYTALCLQAWRFYHVRYSRLLTKDVRLDVLSQIFLFCAKLYGIIFAFLVLLIGGSLLFEIKSALVGFAAGMVIRPLFIPIEIFAY